MHACVRRFTAKSPHWVMKSQTLLLAVSLTYTHSHTWEVEMSQDCKMPEKQWPKHPGNSVKSGNIMDHNNSGPACNHSVTLPSLKKNVQSKISFHFLCETAHKTLPHPHPDTNLKCGCHNTSVVYCSRAQFSIDLLYIAMWESWIKMVWFQLGSRNIIVEIIIAGVWFQPAIVFMSQRRYIYAFKSHTSAETFHVCTFLYLKCHWQDRKDNELISMWLPRKVANQSVTSIEIQSWMQECHFQNAYPSILLGNLCLTRIGFQ